MEDYKLYEANNHTYKVGDLVKTDVLVSPDEPSSILKDYGVITELGTYYVKQYTYSKVPTKPMPQYTIGFPNTIVVRREKDIYNPDNVVNEKTRYKKHPRRKEDPYYLTTNNLMTVANDDVAGVGDKVYKLLHQAPCNHWGERDYDHPTKLVTVPEPRVGTIVAENKTWFMVDWTYTVKWKYSRKTEEVPASFLVREDKAITPDHRNYNKLYKAITEHPKYEG